MRRSDFRREKHGGAHVIARPGSIECITVLSYEPVAHDIVNTIGVLACVELAVGPTFVRARVERTSMRSLVVEMDAGIFGGDIGDDGWMRIGQRAKGLVRWLIREEARNA
jgi:hypothetical protein